MHRSCPRGVKPSRHGALGTPSLSGRRRRAGGVAFVEVQGQGAGRPRVGVHARRELLIGGLRHFPLLTFRRVGRGRQRFWEEAELPCTGQGFRAAPVAARGFREGHDRPGYAASTGPWSLTVSSTPV